MSPNTTGAPSPQEGNGALRESWIAARQCIRDLRAALLHGVTWQGAVEEGRRILTAYDQRHHGTSPTAHPEGTGGTATAGLRSVCRPTSEIVGPAPTAHPTAEPAHMPDDAPPIDRLANAFRFYATFGMRVRPWHDLDETERHHYRAVVRKMASLAAHPEAPNSGCLPPKSVV